MASKSINGSTLHDVAARVGVSSRTVSRVVNGEKGFSAATEERVRAAIEELGYRPNLVARSLITKRSGTIGVIGASMLDPYFPELADGIQQAARDAGLTMFFAANENNAEYERSVVDSLVSRSVDGIIAFPVDSAFSSLVRAATRGVPVVVINANSPPPELCNVGSDISSGPVLALAHLWERGRRSVAYIGSLSSAEGRRSRSYHNSVGSSPIVELAEPTAQGGLDATLALIETAPHVDAILAYNDLMAIGALQALQHIGRRVPDDVAVVGFDDIGLSAFVTPPLTTIALDQIAVGRRAVAKLQEMWSGDGEVPQSDEAEVRLVVRKST